MSKKNQIRRAQQRQQSRAKKSDDAAPAITTAKPSRQLRLDEARRSRHRRSLLARVGVACAVGVVVVGGAGWKVKTVLSERAAVNAMTSGSCNFDRRSDPGAVNQHGVSPTFKINPPSGGIHDPSAAAPGVYSEASLPPAGQIVHALEHGDIAVWYRPRLGETDLERLRTLAGREPDVLLLPKASLPRAVAVLAWHKRLLCDALEPGVVAKFVDRYADEGPENQPD